MFPNNCQCFFPENELGIKSFDKDTGNLALQGSPSRDHGFRVVQRETLHGVIIRKEPQYKYKMITVRKATENFLNSNRDKLPPNIHPLSNQTWYAVGS